MVTHVWIPVVLSCYFILGGALQYGDLRLAGASSSNYGRVEIYLDKVWGTVKYDTYQIQDGVAQTICRQLGFQDMDEVDTVANWRLPQLNTSVPVKLANVYCQWNFFPGNANQHILRCYKDRGPDTPDHSTDMAVRCKYTDYDGYEGAVRLVQIEYKSEGYVEVFLHGSWGSVCNMKTDDADSACRQLGYTNSLGYREKTDHVADSNLNAFHCNSSHSCLYKCYDTPSADATIKCFSGYSYIFCTFDQFQNSTISGGSEALCSLADVAAGSVVAVIIGVMVCLLLLTILVCVVTCICCCCIPGCIVHSRRSRGSYEVINAKYA